MTETALTHARAADGGAAPLDFETAFALHHRAVYGAAYSLLRDAGLAEDVTQEVFLRLHSNRDSAPAGEMLRPWLLRVALNLSYNQLRGRSRSVAREEEFARQSAPEGATAHLDREFERRVREDRGAEMKCIDEGVLQAYNDGELSGAEAGRVAAHLAACEACAATAREAGEEFSAFAAAFSVDESLSVPADRLLSNITAAIAASEAERAAAARAVPSRGGDSIAARWRAFAAALTPRQAAAFAGIALAALLAGAIFYTLQTDGDAPGVQGRPDDMAAVKPPPAQPPGSQSAPDGGVVSPAPQALPGASPSPASVDVAAGGGSQKKGGVGQLAKFTPRGGGPKIDRRGAGPKESLLPVEREYLTEIASLKSAIEGPGTLTPSLRAEYARSLAVVDQAIAASRGAARTNPQDADAQEFLRTAYRDKLDLLSAVADRAQLAGIER
ncbi:MAG: RNA polymerase sigma factor [Acidobacteria bacterium]|nr:RNA polymerase sigma factor [Acidobacteriota bacterium]